jgi:hypothetical protein
MGQWVFGELRGADVRRQPNETELFKTEQTVEGEYAGNDALVREVLQNAIDAGTGDGPVHVRLAIHEAEDAPVPVRLKYHFQRLREPLAGKQISFNGQNYPTIPCRYLVCEDFGTRGLEGDILRFCDPPAGNKAKEDFYWFWRNIGRSGKTGDELGRWGLGKTVYRAASRVGCMFGLTVRQSDRRHLLMGQAVLHIHSLNGIEFMPEGYWCGAQQPGTGLPLPIDAALATELDAFRREWKLTRREQPGLSVVAPFIPDEIKAERLLQAVAVHFFSRIVRGELIVEVVGKGVNERLDQEGIAAVCKRIMWDGPKRTKRHVSPPIAFAKQCLGQPPTAITELLGTEKVPELTEAALSSETLKQLRQKFSAGELTAMRVRMWLPRKPGAGQAGHLDLYLQRLGDEHRCDTYYVREGMTITKINSRAAQRGIQALVTVDPGPLAKLLGDTEGPAHEDWDTSAERPDREWRTWKGRVKFVRGIVDSMVELLTPPTNEPDFDLLSDFFSVEQTTGAQRQRTPGDDKPERPKFDPPAVAPKWYQISEGRGGFTVSRTPQVEMPEKPALVVSVAYDLPSGDPLRNWCVYDFAIGDEEGELKPSGKGLRALKLSGNQLMLLELQADFKVSVKGFDQHRDLYVRVDEMNPDEVNHD